MAHLPWADVVTTGRRSYSGPGAYDLCPRCGKRKKRTTSERCRRCADEHQHVVKHIKSVVKDLVLNHRPVVFYFRENGGPAYGDDTLYNTVTIEWTCRHSWCANVFTTDHYSDEWVLCDAEAVCPRCGSSWILGQCDARLLRQERAKETNDEILE